MFNQITIGSKRKHAELKNNMEPNKENISLNISNHNSQISLIKANNISNPYDFSNNSKLFKSASTINSSQYTFHNRNELSEKNQLNDNTKEKLFCNYELHKRDLLLTELLPERIKYIKQNIPKYFKPDITAKGNKPPKQKNTKAFPIINKYNLKWKQIQSNQHHIKSNANTNNDISKEFQIKQYLHKINVSQYLSITSLLNPYIITFDILYVLYNVLKDSRKDSVHYFIYEIVFKDTLIHLMRNVILKGNDSLWTYEYNDVFTIVLKDTNALYLNEASVQIDILEKELLEYRKVMQCITYQMIMKFFDVAFDMEIGNVDIEDHLVIKDCLVNNGMYMNKTDLIYRVNKDKEKDNVYLKGEEIIKRRINIREVQKVKNNVGVNMFRGIANLNVYYLNTVSLISLYLYDNDVN